MKRRMYSCVLIVGGGLSFDGTENLLQYRIWLNLPPAMRQSTNVLVITKSKVGADRSTLGYDIRGGNHSCSSLDKYHIGQR